MRKIFLVSIIIITFTIACENNNKEVKDTRIELRNDTINIVKLTDTLVIFEGTCRGCEYENSTNFDISDSTGIIKLATIKTFDYSSPDEAGGNVSKEIELVSTKTGKTIVKLYKFWTEQKTAEDSSNVRTYQIEVVN
ncbi:MAG: hypothetical protein KF781_10780 [Chitinophagaceae bacterium]|nr:hypothetical protein [Chitinophagaceae bacterium]MCW5906145.1 hypothetical protein [Chitinophagaceae bacterium]